MAEHSHPVLLHESLDALRINPEGIYLDVTFGGGGHSKPILNRLSAKGHLYAFDQDEASKANAFDDPRFTLVRSNFRFLENFLKYYKVDKVDGILADLGVSSHHFDEEDRGFSYRFDSQLDMRMNRSSVRTARDVIAHSTKEEMVAIFSNYGELRNAKTFADHLIKARSAGVETVNDLLRVIDQCYRGDKVRYTAQVFQALRIEVNDELGVLEEFLKVAVRNLRSQGRLVVITYHSLEDKVVKKYFRSGSLVTRDEYGREESTVDIITRKPILPSKEEILVNSRSASAKLRVIEKR